VTRVLIVDDEPQILRALSITLKARSYDVIVAANGRQALAAAAESAPDIVVLDLGLPDIDGVDVIRGLRGWTKVPIIVLSGRSLGRSKVDALDAGADDYVTKPFNVDELLARLRAVTRRAPGGTDEVVAVIGDLRIELPARRVVRRDPGAAAGGAGASSAEVRLTPTEWQLLEVLIRNPGRLVAQREMLRTIDRAELGDQSHYLRQFMNQLRRKLEPDPARPRHLMTEPGMGYRFQP
jgi:two-component system KDP operon response regulator KdpE